MDKENEVDVKRRQAIKKMLLGGATGLVGLSLLKRAWAGIVFQSNNREFRIEEAVQDGNYIPLYPQHAKAGHLTSPALIEGGDNWWKIGFDDTTEEEVEWRNLFSRPTYRSDMSLKLWLLYSGATANAANSFVVDASVMAVSGSDSVDLETDSFDSANSITLTAPTTADYLLQDVVTLSNKDSIASLDLFALKLARKVDDASDDASGDLEIYAALLFWGYDI
jgi:hypothetical protein